MLLKESSYRGLWWIAGAEKKVPGVLEYSPLSGLQLTLNGVFESSVVDAMKNVGIDHEVIQGRTETGQRITLLENIGGGRVNRLWSNGYAVAEYHVGTALIGKHFPTVAEAVFTTVAVSAPNLRAFVGVSGISSEPGEPNEVRFSVRPAEKFSFRMGEFDVDIVHEQTFSNTLSGIAVDEEPLVRVTAPAACSLDAFLSGPLRSLHTLLMLAVDSVLPLTKIVATAADERDVIVLHHQNDGPEYPSIAHTSELPFALSSIGDREELIGRWHAARGKFGPTFDLYFSVMRNHDIPLEHQFLFLVQALESFHRRAHGDNADHLERHAARLTTILDAVPGAHRKWLQGRLKHSHEPSLEERLNQLHISLPQKVQENIGASRRFAQLTANTRNYLTHFDESRKQDSLVTLDEFWSANQQLSATLKMLFIHTLGLDDSKVLDTTWGKRMLNRLKRSAKILKPRYQ